MRRLLAALAIGLAAAALSAQAADKGKNSLDPIQGRFHKQHTQKLKMGCGTCHAGEKTDVLNARNGRPLPAGMPGTVDRHTCLGCHQKPSKPGWYGGATK